MNTPYTQVFEQEPSVAQPAATNNPQTTHVERPGCGANDAEVDPPARLKCVDVLALVMKDSCLGG